MYHDPQVLFLYKDYLFGQSGNYRNLQKTMIRKVFTFYRQFTPFPNDYISMLQNEKQTDNDIFAVYVDSSGKKPPYSVDDIRITVALFATVREKEIHIYLLASKVKEKNSVSTTTAKDLMIFFKDAFFRCKYQLNRRFAVIQRILYNGNKTSYETFDRPFVRSTRVHKSESETEEENNFEDKIMPCINHISLHALPCVASYYQQFGFRNRKSCNGTVVEFTKEFLKSTITIINGEVMTNPVEHGVFMKILEDKNLLIKDGDGWLIPMSLCKSHKDSHESGF
jgi:hypothetical protein